jgi:hypothetical protein
MNVQMVLNELKELSVGIESQNVESCILYIQDLINADEDRNVIIDELNDLRKFIQDYLLEFPNTIKKSSSL